MILIIAIKIIVAHEATRSYGYVERSVVWHNGVIMQWVYRAVGIAIAFIAFA